jgi:DNA-directed RNA polymerase subunit RPC12/RpoP
MRQQRYLQSVQQFKCGNCGGELQVVNPRTNFIACQYCGTVQEAKTEEHKILLKLAKPSQSPPMRFIKLGMEAVFDGVKYKVIGRTRWQTSYKEWNSESQQYKNSTWQFDEWLLLSEYYSFIYLVEDREGFSLSYPYIPQFPNLPTSEGWVKEYHSGDRKRVTEFGIAKITHFEGESTYQIEVNKEINFAEYKTSNTVYVVESYFYKGTKELQEIEFWREVPIVYAQVLEAFSQNPEVKAKKDVYVAKNKTYRFIRRGFFLLAILFLIAFFLSLSSKNIFNATYTIPYTTANSSADSMQLIATTERFALNTQDEMIEITLTVVSNGFRDGWAGIEICNAQDEVVNTLEGDFYDESDESSIISSQVYKVDKTGEYYIRLYVEPQAWISSYESGVRIEVARVWMLSRYYLTGFIAFLFIGFISTMFRPAE